MKQLELDLLRVSPEMWLCMMHGLYRPKSRSVTFVFDTGIPETTPQVKTFDKTGSFIATRLCHTVRRPNYLDGSSAKLAADVAAAQMPYVDVQFVLDDTAAGVQYNLNTTYSPLENESTFMQTSGQDNTWDRCWVLLYPDFLSVRALLKRTLAASEMPYEVTLTLKGMQVSRETCFTNRPREELIEFIRERHPEAYRALRDGEDLMPIGAASSSSKE